MSRGDVILRLVNVKRIYETQEGRKIVALNGVTTSFKRGEFVAVVGKSGSGKSTLINILGGLDRPDEGDYFLEGNNIADINEGHWDAIRNEKIGFIFQEYHLVEYLSVYKNVEIALMYQNNFNNETKDAKIKQVLTDVGLIDHIHKRPNQLSGGQRQRVAIARALVKDPDIILADEPTGALDHKTSEIIIDLIKGLSKERLVLVVTHDRGIANDHATRIIELTEGRFTNDLIREDIPQTYQNVYKKTKPTNLSLRDKFQLTFRKIRSQLLRTFFTALSLALAFSFTILFNGLERGVSEAYDNYYEALNKANSYSFSLELVDESVGESSYLNASQNIYDTFDSSFYEENTHILMGNNANMAINQGTGGVEHVNVVPSYPDPLGEFKLRLIDASISEQYSFDDLFIGESLYPVYNTDLMVTSKFYREYFQISDNIVSLEEYVGSTMYLPVYNFEVTEGIFGVDEYFDRLYEHTDGSMELDLDTQLDNEGEPLFEYQKVRYLELNVERYCYNYSELNDYYKDRCDKDIIDNKYTSYFDDIDAFIEYIEDFKTQVDNIDPSFFDVLYRSDAIYYMIDENELLPTYVAPFGQRYVERTYRALYQHVNGLDGSTEEISYIDEEAIFRNQESVIEMEITGIIENEHESIIYLDDEAYNDLFVESVSVRYVPGYYTINLESGIRDDYEPIDIALIYFADPLNEVSNVVQEEYKIVRNEEIEQGEVCAIFNVDNILTSSNEIGEVRLLGDIFTIIDYSGCKINTESYHYLSSIRILFGVFFNVLMLISIIFFNILLQVILGERISEIGIYRSVGSTSKDIKYLFFIEIIIEVVLAALMSIFFIYLANAMMNDIFISTISKGSGIVTFAGMKLSLGADRVITNISFFNLLFYVVIVFLLLGFLSNRNVSKLANTKPIDILREVE